MWGTSRPRAQKPAFGVEALGSAGLVQAAVGTGTAVAVAASEQVAPGLTLEPSAAAVHP